LLANARIHVGSVCPPTNRLAETVISTTQFGPPAIPLPDDDPSVIALALRHAHLCVESEISQSLRTSAKWHRENKPKITVG
jgi:hypothetical protein